MPSLTSILTALTVALALALGVAGWQLKRSWQAEALAVSANKTNQATIDRLEADAVIAQAVAIADAQAQRKLETDRDELIEAARIAGPCNSLDALIERRRLQRERDGKQDR
jgi:hypothetical protein